MTTKEVSIDKKIISAEIIKPSNEGGLITVHAIYEVLVPELGYRDSKQLDITKYLPSGQLVSLGNLLNTLQYLADNQGEPVIQPDEEIQVPEMIGSKVFIAASNAPELDKAKADATCNGLNDADLLSDVVTSMGVSGHLELSKGTFNLEKDWDIITNTGGFELSGQGRSTKLKLFPAASPRFALTIGASGNFCYGSTFRDFMLELTTTNANGIDLVNGDQITFDHIYSNYGGTVFRCRKDKPNTEVNAITWNKCHLVRYSQYGIHGVNSVNQSMIIGSTISSQVSYGGVGVLLEGDPFAVTLLGDVFEGNLTSVKMMGGYPKKIEGCSFTAPNDNGQLHLHGGESIDTCWFMFSPIAMWAANNAKVRIENINWQNIGELLKLEGVLHPKSYVDFL